MAAMDEVIAENRIPVLDHGFVRLDASMASDLSVVNAARVSFARRKEELDASDEGLIRFLMRDRHGCYDDRTEVLTRAGWKAWPEVSGDELFATRSIAGELEYQPALRLVRKEHRGHMIGFKGMSIDLLVTPDHRMLVSPPTAREGRAQPRYTLLPAHSVLWRSHRHVATARWRGPSPEVLTFDDVRVRAASFLGLVGLFIGDGSLASIHRIDFDLRKDREIAFLHRVAGEVGLELRRRGQRCSILVGGEMARLFADCYENREKVIPTRLLGLGPRLLERLYEGLLHSDGNCWERRGRADRETYCTASARLADQVQELALKLGRSASVRPHRLVEGEGHCGRKPHWRVTIYSGRNSGPALCRTTAQADEHMGVDLYDGLIHCVEVPNRTLYVRRNGFAAWCGNTPFEHNAFRFHVRAPIFVAREWFRHRIGCLTGDTEITFANREGHTSPAQRRTIDELWTLWTQGERDGHDARRRVSRMRVRVLDEKTGEFAVGHIAAVLDKGVQPVYRLTLADGKHLTLTENHRLLTSDGWQRMGEAVGLDGAGPEARMTSQCRLMTDGVPVHRDRARLVGQRRSESCHRRIHRTAETERAFPARVASLAGVAALTSRPRRGFRLTAHPVDVVAVEYVGLRQTYDLGIDGPSHNFLANGVVVHNSFNEFSMRYAKATDDFYVPEPEDVRTQVGKPGAYSFDPVEPELAERTRRELQAVYEQAYATYAGLVEQGVAREVARSVLPVGAYTEFYWTVNARALMNFVSLRAAETAQREIRRYADAVERFFSAEMPITYDAFVRNDRTAP